MVGALPWEIACGSFERLRRPGGMADLNIYMSLDFYAPDRGSCRAAGRAMAPPPGIDLYDLAKRYEASRRLRGAGGSGAASVAPMSCSPTCEGSAQRWACAEEPHDFEIRRLSLALTLR